MISVESETSDAYRAESQRKKHKHVGRACIHCKKAHLACDNARPCKRCVHLGKHDCVDVEHKRRGRPRSNFDKRRPKFVSSNSPDDQIEYLVDYAASHKNTHRLGSKKLPHQDHHSNFVSPMSIMLTGEQNGIECRFDILPPVSLAAE